MPFIRGTRYMMLARGAARNAAPVIVVPGAQSATSNVAKAITGTSLSDADGNTQTVTLTTNHSGTVSLASLTGLTGSGDGTNSLSYSGTISALNTALATLTYTSATDYEGSETISISTSDGAGGTDSDSIAITVTWTPASLSSLVAWFDPSYCVYANSAAKFVAASSQSLSKASAIISKTNGYTISYWVKPTDSTRRGLVSWASAYAYGSTFVSYGTYIVFAINDGSFRNLTLTRGANGTWSHVTVRFDPTVGTYGTLYCSVRPAGSSANTKSHTLTGDGAGSDIFKIGFGVDGEADCSIDSLGAWNRVISDDEITSLYNSGSGKTYADLTTAEKVSLVSWYDFATTASLGTDAHGSNTLTNTNSVTCDAGIAAGACVADDPVYRWYAKNDAAIYAYQSTLSARPIYTLGANSKPYLNLQSGSKGMASNITNTFGDFTCGVAYCADGSGYNSYERLVDKAFDTGFFIGRDVSVANSFRSGIVDGSAPLGIAISLTDGQWNNIITRRSGTTQTLTNGAGVSDSASCSGTAMSSTALVIGYATSGGGGYDGKIGHIVICSDDITDSEMTLLATYLTSQVPT